MKQTLAIFKTAGSKGDHYYNTQVWPVDMDGAKGHVRMTEFIEIDFPDVQPAVMIKQEIEILDDMVEKLKKDTMDKISAIEEKRAELLSITYQDEVAA